MKSANKKQKKIQKEVEELEKEESEEVSNDEDININEEEDEQKEESERFNDEDNNKSEKDEENDDDDDDNNNENKDDKKEDENNNNLKTNGIFISGLPYKMEESEIRDIFSKYGDIIELKVPKYQDSGRNIGYCHVYYKTHQEAKKALELDHYEVGSRYLTVQMAKKDNEELNVTQKINKEDVPQDCLTAFVKNLPYDITEQEVGDKFRSCGRIKGIRFVYNSKNKKFKGFCFIDFKEHMGLIKALELNGKEIKGRKMKVDFETGKPKKGYKYNNEAVTSKYNKEHVDLLNKKRKKMNK